MPGGGSAGTGEKGYFPSGKKTGVRWRKPARGVADLNAKPMESVPKEKNGHHTAEARKKRRGPHLKEAASMVARSRTFFPGEESRPQSYQVVSYAWAREKTVLLRKEESVSGTQNPQWEKGMPREKKGRHLHWEDSQYWDVRNDGDGS